MTSADPRVLPLLRPCFARRWPRRFALPLDAPAEPVRRRLSRDADVAATTRRPVSPGFSDRPLLQRDVELREVGASTPPGQPEGVQRRVSGRADRDTWPGPWHGMRRRQPRERGGVGLGLNAASGTPSSGRDQREDVGPGLSESIMANCFPSRFAARLAERGRSIARPDGVNFNGSSRAQVVAEKRGTGRPVAVRHHLSQRGARRRGWLRGSKRAMGSSSDGRRSCFHAPQDQRRRSPVRQSHATWWGDVGCRRLRAHSASRRP